MVLVLNNQNKNDDATYLAVLYLNQIYDNVVRLIFLNFHAIQIQSDYLQDLTIK